MLTPSGVVTYWMRGSMAAIFYTMAMFSRTVPPLSVECGLAAGHALELLGASVQLVAMYREIGMPEHVEIAEALLNWL
jgi:hypothetical protein